MLVQAVLTFAARRASAVFGYDLLAAARESIVRTVLRLPLGLLRARVALLPVAQPLAGCRGSCRGLGVWAAQRR